MSNKKRGQRAGGADLYAARQNADVEADEPEELPAPDDVEVIETDEPEPDGDEPDDEPSDPAEGDNAALTTMQRQLAAMQAERDEALQRADAATGDVVVSQQAILTQALNGAKVRAADAEAEIAAASKAGDHVGVAKATAKLSKAIQDQDRFELAVDEIGAEIEERKKPAAKAKPAASADPYVDSLKAFSDPSKDWLIKRREHIEGNAEVGEKAQALAMHAIKVLGIKEDSPEFFAHLDKGLGFTEVKRAKPQPGRPQTAAPSGARGGATGKTNEVSLTRQERDAARQMGMTLAEYGRNKLEIQKNGQDDSRPGLRFSAATSHSSRR